MKKNILFFVTIIMLSVLVISCGRSGEITTSERTRTTTYYQGDVLPKQQEWKRCAVCDGKGSCKPCKGTGRISGDQCKKCKGSGKCQTCKGDGGYYLEN